METAWVLRHEHPDIFEQVIILLRDRMERFAKAAEIAELEALTKALAQSGASARSGEGEVEEESAI